ncbi:hypothetical protein PYCC9005_003206 [Savitreella phatthalungensis]
MLWLTLLLQVRCVLCQSSPSQPVVDIGYARVRGFTETSTSTEAFKGVRYAAPPKRWQRATAPATNRTAIIDATAYASRCPQSASAGGSDIDPLAGGLASEDCLFLNVFRPAKTNSSAMLPVAVYFHGGGYSQLTANINATYLSRLSGENFLFVSVAYRLGALGFLASQELVEGGGILNVGLLDQEFALQWVNTHIAAFGGDPSRVTIWGESAGGGSVMQHLLAYDGKRNRTLFNQAILASPSLPQQRWYNDSIPTAYYRAFVDAAGCTNKANVVDCLRTADLAIVAGASNNVSRTAPSRRWAFNPVIDGTFVTGRPSELLLRQQIVQNVSLLVGSNFDEGSVFIPSNITNAESFEDWLTTLLPKFTNLARAKLRTYYPAHAYATQFRRAASVLADTIYNCPAVWLADAAQVSWRYQYDVAPGLHGLDLTHYLPTAAGIGTPGASAVAFDTAFATIFSSFIVRGRPVSNGTFALPRWAVNATDDVRQARFNRTTTGSPNITVSAGRYITSGRDRCDFWLAYAPLVPE